MKYIVMDHTNMIIFQRHISHDTMSEKNGGAENVTSAGFIRNSDDGLVCYGYSYSLCKSSVEGDTEILQISLMFKE